MISEELARVEGRTDGLYLLSGWNEKCKIGGGGGK